MVMEFRISMKGSRCMKISIESMCSVFFRGNEMYNNFKSVCIWLTFFYGLQGNEARASVIEFELCSMEF